MHPHRTTQFPVFLTYARLDDSGFGGISPITTLQKEIERECRQLLGDPSFGIFQDIEDIPPGEDWRTRITSALDEAMLLLVVLSPSSLSSPYCLEEIRRFEVREGHLGRNDLIIPLLWTTSDSLPTLGTTTAPAENERLLRRQHVDLSKIRTILAADYGTNPDVHAAVVELAQVIVAAIRRTQNARRGAPADSPDRLLYLRPLSSGTEQDTVSPPFPLGYGTLPIGGGNGHPPPDPARDLLRTAIRQKHEGRYDDALATHGQLMRLDVDWSMDVDLFCDQMYFAISLYDKLERWTELKRIDTEIFRPSLAKLATILDARRMAIVALMHATSMSLASYRQLNFREGEIQLVNVLAEIGNQEPQQATNILKANAHATLAMNLIGMATFLGKQSDQRDAADRIARHLADAEALLRRYAQLGKADEYHHAGRLYALKVFAELLRRGTGQRPHMDNEALLQCASKAHAPDGRTRYGKVAGMYCEAACLHALRPKDRSHAAQATHLLQAALESLNGCLSQAHVTRFRVALLGDSIEQGRHPGFAAELQSCRSRLLEEPWLAQFTTVDTGRLQWIPLN